MKTGLAALMLLAISCTKEPLRNPQAASTQTKDNAVAKTTGHYIGERFGGGIIFYIDSTGEHGLIADPVDSKRKYLWNNGAYILIGSTSTQIGTGGRNTRKIVLTQGAPGSYAARGTGFAESSP